MSRPGQWPCWPQDRGRGRAISLGQTCAVRRQERQRAVEEVSTLTLTATERAHYATVGIAAYLLVPLVRDGKFAYVFVTGYDQEAIPDEFTEVKRLEKPLQLRGS